MKKERKKLLTNFIMKNDLLRRCTNCFFFISSSIEIKNCNLSSSSSVYAHLIPQGWWGSEESFDSKLKWWRQPNKAYHCFHFRLPCWLVVQTIGRMEKHFVFECKLQIIVMNTIKLYHNEDMMFTPYTTSDLMILQ